MAKATTLLTTAASVLLLVSSPATSAAHAESSATSRPASAQACSTWLSNPVHPFGTNYVFARAHATDCQGWRFTAWLQRSRWYGWENWVVVHWSGNAKKKLQKNCAGTHTYRARMRRVNPIGGVLPDLRSTERRFTC